MLSQGQACIEIAGPGGLGTGRRGVMKWCHEPVPMVLSRKIWLEGGRREKLRRRWFEGIDGWSGRRAPPDGLAEDAARMVSSCRAGVGRMGLETAARTS